MTATSTPPVIQRALDAANAGRTQEFLDCFAPDGAVDDWGRVFHGRDAIRGWSDAEFIGVQVALSPTGVTRDGDIVTISAHVGGNGYTGPSHFAFTVPEDRIALMRITG
jgi:hypothetical protein